MPHSAVHAEDSASNPPVRARQNFALPILNLPNEILLDIFDLASTTRRYNRELDGPLDNRMTRNRRMLFGIMQTCRLWHDVAVGSARLWNHFALVVTEDTTLEHLIRAELFVERSRHGLLSAELKIARIYSPDEDTDMIVSAAVQLVGQELRRTRSLELVDNLGNSLRRVMENQDAPELISLSIRSDDAAVELHPSFLSGGTPKLRLLRLVNTPVRWDGSLFRDLTWLQISDIAIERRLTFAEVWNILSNCPRLQHLRLYEAGPDGDEPPDSGHFRQPITLDHLLAFELDCPPAICLTILTHTRLPALKELRLSNEGQCPAHVSEFLPDRLAPPLRDAVEIRLDEGGFVIKSRGNADPDTSFTLSYKDFDLLRAGDPWRMAQLLASAGQHWDHSRLTSLKFVLSRRMEAVVADPISVFLRPLGSSNLHALHFQFVGKAWRAEELMIGNGIGLIMESFCDDSYADLAQNDDRRFPVLEKLTLEDVDFRDHRRDASDWGLSDLHDFLVFHRAAGVGLRKLVLNRCLGIQEAQAVEHLRPFLTELEFIPRRPT